MEVKFIDLKAQYLAIKDEIDEAIGKVIESNAFSSGPFVKEFEDNFASVHGTRYCIGLNSGTSALHIVMMALGIGPGDEVIVPANTFFATPEAVSLAGATPVFVDCEQDFYNIDIQWIEKAITKRTKAVIVVHLYGHPANMNEIKALCESKKGIYLIEDCAQSHVSRYLEGLVGTFGICGCFSFYPSKNLGAFGEAGAVITDNEELFLKLNTLRDHGSKKKYYHDLVGHNYRMDGIQGAVLNVKLKYLEQWTQSRRKNAALYNQYMDGIKEIVTPKESHKTRHVYHLYVIQAERRDQLQQFLIQNNIHSAIHYPVPCHLQKAYDTLTRVNLPVCEDLASKILSLPMYAELTELEIECVSMKIRQFYGYS